MISNKWKEVPLSDICEIVGGGTPKTKVADYWDGDIPWLSVVDFNNPNRHVSITEKSITERGLNNSSTKLLNSGDIIISARGTVGALAQLARPMAFNQSCYGIRANKGAVNDFLYYAIRNIMSQIKANTHGSVFDTITRATFDNLKILLPSSPEQKAIAATLSCLDDKIEINNKINHNLEQMAQAIFKSWFVDFEPFGGEYPSDWHIGNLIDIADYLNGLAMQRFRPVGGEDGLPVLKIKDLRQGFCDSSSELCSPNIRSEYIIHDGDVVFSWSGSLLVDFWCGGDCGLNQHLFKVTSERYDKWFYYAWTCHHLANFVAIAAGKATTMGHIKREDLEKAKVLIPDNNSYCKIGKLLTPLYEKIISNRLENSKLIILRDTILPKLMTGEISAEKVSNE